jgi:hypothetical protein
MINHELTLLKVGTLGSSFVSWFGASPFQIYGVEPPVRFWIDRALSAWIHGPVLRRACHPPSNAEFTEQIFLRARGSQEDQVLDHPRE